jgi:hypothetical protein
MWRAKIAEFAPILVLLTVALPTVTFAGGDASKRTEEIEKRLKALRSLPYTAVSRTRVEKAKVGVLVHNEAKAYPGYNFYCNSLASEVLLTDMKGTIVHSWKVPLEGKFWPLGHAIMLDDGGIVAISTFKELIRLDWDSNPIWRAKVEAHHDVTLAPDGTLYAIVREQKTHKGLRVRFPAIVHLTNDGKEIDRWSTYYHYDEIKQKFDQRSFIDAILDSMPERGRDRLLALNFDPFHFNTISIIPPTPLGQRDSTFGAGNLLICLRNVNQIAILDKDTKEILWVWGEGSLQWPHHPTMLENGNILIFDNGVKREYSRIVELNPVTKEIEWEYAADPPEAFYTYERGSAQYLPNGNTLVCDGDNGRAFEVTRDGEIVWEWFNTITTGGRRVQAYRVIRHPPEIVRPLLVGSSPGS